ncbi:MAG: DUF1549 domain-containing protein [Bacteroidota bacterium]
MNILLASTWIWEFLGRLHPMIVHFPIGILVVAFLLELSTFWRKPQAPFSRKHNQIWVTIGAISALFSALFGTLLYQFGSYQGTTIQLHLIGGWITALLATFAAFSYTAKPPNSHTVSMTTLGLAVLSLVVTGHWGASITHGANYLTEVLPSNEGPTDHERSEKLALFTSFSQQDSFPPDQLDQLNLEVRAIFAHNCYQCHSTEKQKGGLILDSKEGVFKGGDSGPILLPGNSEKSEIIRRLELPRSHEESMPPKGKVLASSEISLVHLWIDQGAHWADASLSIFPEASMALSKPVVPPASPQFSHPVDRFVNQYFQEKGRAWPKFIDDRTFIRRVYLDVWGLLPEPDYVQAFIEDPNPKKRGNLIDKLLEEEHNYTQHALSFWNDLLRNDYSGTGFITGGRKQISSWLYQSLASNKSYDQMLRELVNPIPESEGFIKGIRWRGGVNSSQRPEMQAAQNISQSLLGVNMKCASCHNSFVNNLTLDQSYAFANVFTDTTLEIFRCDKPTGRMASRAFIYPELGEIAGADLATRLEELAGLMSKPENGRVYRTLVNRYWDRLFGRGIIAPVDNMDKKAWDQDLLDWLSADFIANGYDIKHLLRTLLSSQTYSLESFAYPSSAYLRSESFEFSGPTHRRLSAEQFVDVVSQIISPVYHSVAYDPSGYASSAEWIWHPEIEVDRHVLPKPGMRYFRKTFTIPDVEKLTDAHLLLSVDHRFTLYLNGKFVGSGSDWREVFSRNVKEFLQQGENLIAIEGQNEGSISNPAGILLSLALTDSGGETAYVVSDRTWQSTQISPPKNWFRIGFEATGWEKVRRFGSFQRSHWGKPLAFRHALSDTTTLSFARASLVQLDPFLKVLGRPVRENVTTKRPTEATLLQTLTLSNDAALHEVLSKGAQHWKNAYPNTPDRLVEDLYLYALGRKPNKQEKGTLYTQIKNRYTEQDIADIFWAVILLPEFQLIP